MKPDWKWCSRCKEWCSIWNRKIECLFCGAKLRDKA